VLDDRQRALATVDLAAVRHNIAHLVALLPAGTALCAVVKANGYGHGAVPVARAALRAGASWLGVATVTEAEELREAAIAAPLLIFGPMTGAETARAAKAHAEVAVWSQAFLDEALRRRLRVHVKFNSGMGRLGVDAAAAAAWAAAAGPGLSGLMSHFATADEDDPAFFVSQLERFTALAGQLKARHAGLSAHIANSAATMREPAAHFDMVRTGIAIYGLSPFGDDPLPRGLRPALRLSSYVAAIREVGCGESVGYGRAFIADGPARLAIVPIGYADGIARALTNRGDVLIAGRRCRITGTISMDQLTVLLPGDTAAVRPRGPAAVRPGDEVVFIGRSGAERILAEDVARLLGTINYEIACDVSSRVVRRYADTPAAGDAVRGPSLAGLPATPRAPLGMSPAGGPADPA
jgi:alanine racemase